MTQDIRSDHEPRPSRPERPAAPGTQRLSRRNLLAGAAALAALPALPGPAAAQSGPAEVIAGTRIETMAEGLREPWSLGFLPDGGFVVTERGGRLSQFGPRGGRALARLTGLPEVAAAGQGGLLDVMVPRDFATSRELFLSFARPQTGGGAGTALAVARLSGDGRGLERLRIIFEAREGGRGGRHFGSRIVELRDGTLALTIGDRGDDAAAQDLGRHEGKVVRIARDGSVPRDNPHRDRAGALPEIWSHGHRNPQGAALDGQGRLWVSEHGARGGDEINLVRAGANYGWPVISYGRHYSGARIGVGTSAPGMEQPAHYWDPSIAPSGHAILSGSMFAELRGWHLVGSLNADHIAALDPERAGPGGWAGLRIEVPQTARVRDIREGPDGAIWFLSVQRGAVFRLLV